MISRCKGCGKAYDAQGNGRMLYCDASCRERTYSRTHRAENTARRKGWQKSTTLCNKCGHLNPDKPEFLTCRRCRALESDYKYLTRTDQAKFCPTCDERGRRLSRLVEDETYRWCERCAYQEDKVPAKE